MTVSVVRPKTWRMTGVIVYHHALGLTDGIRGFADELRAAGHTVHTPDLFDGQVFATIEEGVTHAEDVIGFTRFVERGKAAAETLPAEVVYIGFSAGVLPAQLLTQTRPGARGAVLCYSTIPVSEFGEWPAGVPVQIHGMDRDPYFAGEGDVDAARELVENADQAELFLYEGDGHLFADPTHGSYDPEAAVLLTKRVLDFLASVSD